MKKTILNKFSLNNKKAFIFGGCGLIGSKVASIFTEAGANTFVFDNDKKTGKRLEKKFNASNFKYIHSDISNIKTIDNKFKNFMKSYGCPNIFVNCSYPITKDWVHSTFSKNTIKSLKKNVEIHLDSYVWWSHKICKEMKKRKIKGSIVLFSSIYGVLGQNMSIYKKTSLRENMNYSVIKGGITNFSKQLASYYGKNGIRVNAICPGGISGHVKGSKKKQDKKFVKNYSDNNPLNRLGTAEEVALSVLFLSSEASSYITGTSFMVDGGWSAI